MDSAASRGNPCLIFQYCNKGSIAASWVLIQNVDRMQHMKGFYYGMQAESDYQEKKAYDGADMS